jgi:signal recognition particle subunit SEC65
MDDNDHLLNLVKQLRFHQKIYMKEKYPKTPNEELKSFHGEIIDEITQLIDQVIARIDKGEIKNE